MSLLPTSCKPAHFSLASAIRPNILSLTPYRCARDDYNSGILLDANENSLGHSLPSSTRNGRASTFDEDEDEENAGTSQFDSLDLHRYPSPTHFTIKESLALLRQVPSRDQIFLGVGSDEVIDLLFRISCTPGKDRVIVCPPTYGMYSVCAQINDVEVVKVPLDDQFQLDLENIERTIEEASTTSTPIKLIFICSPGNPTGTLIPLAAIRSILSNPSFTGLLIVDEAYIDFTPSPSSDSAITLLREEKWDNLVIMQTLSKGFGLAAIRMGLGFGSKELIQVLNNVKAPYNISTPTAELAKRALSEKGLKHFRKNIEILNTNRDYLKMELIKFEDVLEILGRNHANFLLVRIGRQGKRDNDRAKTIYTIMAESEGVVVRFRGNEMGCEACVRITVGTKDECDEVLKKLRKALDQTK